LNTSLLNIELDDRRRRERPILLVGPDILLSDLNFLERESFGQVRWNRADDLEFLQIFQRRRVGRREREREDERT
jgi:hypothetical protein